MKKYFSLIAVAMIAVSSVFTSCSKDDEGSSFCPQVTTQSTSQASNQTAAQSTKSDSIQQNAESKTGDEVFVYMADGKSASAEVQSQVVDKLIPVLQAKLGALGTISKVSNSNHAAIQVTYKNSNRTPVYAAMDCLLAGEIEEAVGSMTEVSKVTVQAMGNGWKTVEWTRNN